MLVGATLNAKQARLLLKTFVLLNVLFLLGTFLINYPGIHLNRYLRIFFKQSDLGSENTVAAWYSSMLLLCSALMSVVCFIADRGSVWKFGWLVYAACFATLSFDEMGSIHEYIGDYAAFKSAGKAITKEENSGWSIFYYLIAIVSAGMLLFSFIRLKKVKWALLFLILGVAFYLTNPLQENYEIEHYGNSGHRPVYLLLLEEGSEIFGSLFFLLATSLYAAGRSGEGINTSFSLTRRSLLLYTFFFFIAAAAVLALLTYLFGYVQGQNQTGVPKNWVVSAIAFILFLYCFYCFVNAGNDRRLYFVLSAVTLLVSVYFGCDRWAYILPSFHYAVEAGFLFLATAWLVLLKKSSGGVGEKVSYY